MKEKTLSEEIEYMNEISPDFIGDNAKTMKEGTITPIGYIKAEKVKQKFKETLNEIEDGESFGNYLWQQYQTDNEKVNEIIADLIRDVMSQIDRHKQIIKQKSGFEELE